MNSQSGAATITPPAGTSAPPINPNFKPTVPPAGSKQYVLTVDTGDVLIRFPENISDEDYETIDPWIDAMKRKIKRSVKGDGREG